MRIVYRMQLFCVLMISISFARAEVSLTEQLFENVDGEESSEQPHQVQSRRTKDAKPKVDMSPVQCTTQGQFGIHDECSKHYVCSRPSQPASIGICRTNRRFHHQKRKCLRISDDQCKETMCKAPSDKFPDPYTKENYLICLKMTPEVRSCKEGEIYDQFAETCVEGSIMAGLKSASEEDHTEEQDKPRSKPVPPMFGRSFRVHKKKGAEASE